MTTIIETNETMIDRKGRNHNADKRKRQSLGDRLDRKAQAQVRRARQARVEDYEENDPSLYCR